MLCSNMIDLTCSQYCRQGIARAALAIDVVELQITLADNIIAVGMVTHSNAADDFDDHDIATMRQHIAQRLYLSQIGCCGASSNVPSMLLDVVDDRRKFKQRDDCTANLFELQSTILNAESFTPYDQTGRSSQSTQPLSVCELPMQLDNPEHELKDIAATSYQQARYMSII